MSQTRQNLIEAASELIWRSSYGSVSVDDICKKANVKKGSFYHFFKSKTDLAIASMDHYYELTKIDLDRLFSPTIPALQRFENLADHICEKQAQAYTEYGHVCGCPFATLGCEMAAQEEQIRSKIDDIFNAYCMYFESALRDLVSDGTLPPSTDIKSLAYELHSYGMGQATMARIQNSLHPLKDLLKDGWARMIRGAITDVA